MILYMYIAPGKWWQPLGDEILMSSGTSCHFGHLFKFKKNLFEVWFYTIFFHDFIHVYSTRAGADSPQGTKFWCQQKCLVTSFICCKFKKNVFEVWFYTLYFYDLIHVYSPGAGADSPQGTKFRCQQKRLVTSVICCQVQITEDKVSEKSIVLPFSHIKAKGTKFDLVINRSRSTQGHHLNKIGSPRAPDAAYEVSRSSAILVLEKIF